mmetsp:Transcript_33237/g.116566  ORF Transcript_33237/g.116566 Transcript_33237/m.116566 type:complete len:396 (+) Transcript_33237:332-1519(+)
MEDEGASSDVLEDLRLDGAPSVVVPGGATAPGPREEYDEMAVHYAKQALHCLMLKLSIEVKKGLRGPAAAAALTIDSGGGGGGGFGGPQDGPQNGFGGPPPTPQSSLHDSARGDGFSSAGFSGGAPPPAAAAASAVGQSSAVAALLAQMEEEKRLRQNDGGPALLVPVLSADKARRQTALERNLAMISQMDGSDSDGDWVAPTGSHENSGKGDMKFANVSKAGIGAKGFSRGVEVKVGAVENTSCYVSGIPLHVAAETLEGLFAVHGKILKLKIYVDNLTGLPKGDALVTFNKAGSVGTAVLKLHDFEVSPGNLLNVTKAAFHSDAALSGAGPIVKPKTADLWVSQDGLPERCGSRLNPVVLLRHLYEPGQCRSKPKRDFLDELEVRLLVRCNAL